MKVYVVRCYLENADELDSIWGSEANALERVIALNAEWVTMERRTLDWTEGAWAAREDEIERGITYSEWEMNRVGG
jgi:hypothetical protein